MRSAAMRYLLLILMLLTVSACQLAPLKGEQAPAYLAVPVGSELILTQDITIPANQTSVYVQNGKVTTYSGRDQYYPNCKFELYPISDKPRPVKADSFHITRVQRDTDYASTATPMYAGPVNSSDGGPLAIIYTVTFSLQSRLQPDVFRMSCEYWADPVSGEDLTLGEVRQTLKPLFVLNVK